MPAPLHLVGYVPQNERDVGKHAAYRAPRVDGEELKKRSEKRPVKLQSTCDMYNPSQAFFELVHPDVCRTRHLPRPFRQPLGTSC